MRHEKNEYHDIHYNYSPKHPQAVIMELQTAEKLPFISPLRERSGFPRVRNPPDMFNRNIIISFDETQHYFEERMN